MKPFLFGDRLTVGQQVLVLFIGVRIPVPEQALNRLILAYFLYDMDGN